MRLFGKVIEGLDTVDEIAQCDTDFSDKPLESSDYEESNRRKPLV